ncbi:MAG: hypothetical protein Q7U80_12195 [Thiobacillus sp.]|nr:hypothetical protein [Gammaproteobacteria bacterium]MDO9008972.1 hypothetical protein [Thiobacillus sp.]
MSTELPAESVVAIATVIAALIASAISFVNLTLTKEQKTSEFRQIWIDALRQDLASFFATARAFARASQEQKLFGGGSKEGAPLALTEEKISDLRYQIAETRYRIQLRLNPKEIEHLELLRLMQVAIEKQQQMLAGKGDTDAIMKAIEVAAEYAPQILKSEWERVKKGEIPYRLARNWVAPIMFFGSFFFIILLWVEKIKI